MPRKGIEPFQLSLLRIRGTNPCIRLRYHIRGLQGDYTFSPLGFTYSLPTFPREYSGPERIHSRWYRHRSRHQSAPRIVRIAFRYECFERHREERERLPYHPLSWANYPFNLPGIEPGICRRGILYPIVLD